MFDLPYLGQYQRVLCQALWFLRNPADANGGMLRV